MTKDRFYEAGVKRRKIGLRTKTNGKCAAVGFARYYAFFGTCSKLAEREKYIQ